MPDDVFGFWFLVWNTIKHQAVRSGPIWGGGGFRKAGCSCYTRSRWSVCFSDGFRAGGELIAYQPPSDKTLRICLFLRQMGFLEKNAIDTVLSVQM